MRRFYLFKRGNVYYCQLKNPLTGKPLPPKSTGKEKRDDAELVAMSWLVNGIPNRKTKDPRSTSKVFTVDEVLTNLKNIDELTETDVTRFLEYFKNQGFIKSVSLSADTELTLTAYLLSFWDYDNSLYVKEKLSHGHKITRGYCNDMTRWVERYWKPYFDSLPITELTREKLKQFSIHLAELFKTDRKGNITTEHLSHATINHILKSGTVPLKRAADERIISENPATALMKFSGDHKRRGILSDKEVKKVFSPAADWGGNDAARLANYLCMQTGLRSGEVLALQVKDIDDDRIQVRHSYSKTEGLKAPKNGETRQVPLLPETRQMLIDHAKTNPYGYQPESFIFYQVDNPDRPMRQETLNSRLTRALASIDIDDTQKAARGLCLHSWRHYYVKKMTDVIDKRAMALSGHKSQSVFDMYGDKRSEEDFKAAAAATAEVFGRVLQFPEKGGKQAI